MSSEGAASSRLTRFCGRSSVIWDLARIELTCGSTVRTIVLYQAHVFAARPVLSSPDPAVHGLRLTKSHARDLTFRN
jgi:hypothetical protein